MAEGQLDVPHVGIMVADILYRPAEASHFLRDAT